MPNFEDKYNSNWQATRTHLWLTDEWYDSRMEASDIGVLELLGGIKYHSNGVTFLAPYFKGGSFKPDLIYSVIPNSESAIRTAKQPFDAVEIKGFLKGEENERKRWFMAKCVSDPRDEMNAAFWQMKDTLGILGFDGAADDWEPSAVYNCPRCGGTFYRVKTRHRCPYCNEANPTFITDKSNGLFNKWMQEICDETDRRLSELTAENKRGYYDQIAQEVVADFKKKLRPKGAALNAKFQRELAPELEGIDFKALVSDAYKIG